MSQGYASQYKLYLKYAKNFKKMAKKQKILYKKNIIYKKPIDT